MLQLRQLNLQFAFVAFRTQGEDIQDQRNAVHHAQIESAFKVALLGGRQRLIKQNDVGQ
ncbi:hypothetical protein D3C73_1279050 [compost metagenome]